MKRKTETDRVEKLFFELEKIAMSRFDAESAGLFDCPLIRIQADDMVAGVFQFAREVAGPATGVEDARAGGQMLFVETERIRGHQIGGLHGAWR